MAQHFDKERALQRRIEVALEAALPDIEVLDVELNDPQHKVTVFIDHPDGVGLAHCEAVTHAIRDTCPDHELEVSSPGIERPMRRASQFRLHLGQKVRLRQAGSHRASVVLVKQVDDQAGVTVEAPDGGAQLVAFNEIIRCKLVAEDAFTAAARKEGRS